MIKPLIAIILVLLLPIQSGQQTVSVAIENPSFEPTAALNYYPSDPCGIRGQSVDGWAFGAGSGVFQPDTCGIASPPNGKTVAYAGYGSTFSQTLTITPAELQQLPNRPTGYMGEGVYTLKFYVANYFPSYPGYYTAEIDFGTQELCEASGWGSSTFTQVTVVCPGPAYIVVDHSLSGNGSSGPPQGHNDFVIHFTAGGWTLLFDDVSLTFTAANP